MDETIIKPVDKDELYKLTDFWASWECNNLIETLHHFGLVIVKEEDIKRVNMFCNLYEDDLK